MNPLSKGLKAGVVLTSLVGMMVLALGVLLLNSVATSLAEPDQPWVGGGNTDSTFSYRDLETAEVSFADGQQGLARTMVLATRLEGILSFAVGGMILCLSLGGLRQAQRWVWWTLLGTFLWVGLVEGWALVQGGHPPLSLAAMVLGLSGLACSWRAVFRP